MESRYDLGIKIPKGPTLAIRPAKGTPERKRSLWDCDPTPTGIGGDSVAWEEGLVTRGTRLWGHPARDDVNPATGSTEGTRVVILLSVVLGLAKAQVPYKYP